MKKSLVAIFVFLIIGTSNVSAAVDSYELFYPMVAGKTVADGFIYKLKILKENIRGSLIFGTVQKENYNVYLATKRLLEAEKLLTDKKDDFALVALDATISHLTSANKGSEKIKTLSIDMVKTYSEKPEVSKKLQEISRFAP